MVEPADLTWESEEWIEIACVTHVVRHKPVNLAVSKLLLASTRHPPDSRLACFFPFESPLPDRASVYAGSPAPIQPSLTAQSLDRMTRMECRSQADQSLIIPVLIQAIIVHSTQVDLVDFCADSSAQTRSCILVGSKMYPAVNASVGDVVGNLPE